MQTSQGHLVDFLKEPSERVQSEMFVTAARYANERWTFGLMALVLGIVAGCVAYRITKNDQ